MENYDEIIKEDYISILDGLSEAELFFCAQEVMKRRKEIEYSEKLEGMLAHVIKLTKNFGVSQPTMKRPGTFMKWLAFWKNWQSELTISDMETLVDCLLYKRPFDELLPTHKWNEKPIKPTPPTKGNQG